MLNYEEDGFDLAAHKNSALERARETAGEQVVRRRVTIYKFLIMVVAFALMFLLYNFINDFIIHYQYIRYSAAQLVFMLI